MMNGRKWLTRRMSYLDRAPNWYDTHTRVFYIYFLGRYHNKRLYCYGETNDLDAIEFKLSSYVPSWTRVTYVPLYPHLNREFIDTVLASYRVVIPIRGMEEWSAFEYEDSVDDLIDKLNLKEWVDE